MLLIHWSRGQRTRAKLRRRLAQQKANQKQAAERAAQRRLAHQLSAQPLIYPQRVMIAGAALLVGATLTVALMNSPLLYGLIAQQDRAGGAGKSLLRDRYVDGILPSASDKPSEPQQSIATPSDPAQSSSQASTQTGVAASQSDSKQSKPRTKLSRSRTSRLSAPRSVNPGTVIWLDGDSSLVRLSQLLRYEFKHRYPGTDVQMGGNGSQTALRSVLEGNLDVAAIGRPLTDQEIAQGLVAVPMARHKIAVLIGSDNPFNGSLTNQQFASILRGEISNWKQVGGQDIPLRLIDRAKDNATRQALLSYPIFADVEAKMPAQVARQPGDRLSDIAQGLGIDGITYALIDQVSDDITTPNIVNRGDVKIVPLHQVLPDDPRYSFSQPMVYVYHGQNPTPEAEAFLGYATVLRRRGILADGASLNARRSWFETQTFGWSVLALLSLGLVGASRFRHLVDSTHWIKLAGLNSPSNLSGSVLQLLEAHDDGVSNYLILDAMEGKPLEARWQLSSETVAQQQQQGGKLLQLRLYEFKPGESQGFETDYRRRPFREYRCPGADGSLQLSSARRNHRYLAEIGYLTADDRWLKLITSILVATEATPSTFLEKVAGSEVSSDRSIKQRVGNSSLVASQTALAAGSQPGLLPGSTPSNPASISESLAAAEAVTQPVTVTQPVAESVPVT